jgi:hypothetical protein
LGLEINVKLFIPVISNYNDICNPSFCYKDHIMALEGLILHYAVSTWDRGPRGKSQSIWSIHNAQFYFPAMLSGEFKVSLYILGGEGVVMDKQSFQ